MSSASQGGGEHAREVPGQPPLTVTAPLLLRTHELSWEALEHLVVALAVQADRALESRPFGRGGQAQDGVDVVAFFTSQPPAVYQAKRYEKFTAADLRKAVATYTDGSRPFDAHRLVIVTTADVRDTKVDLELTQLREQHQDLVVDLWGRQQLSDMLFVLPDLVRRFFGEDTMRVFCRPMLDREMQADISDVSKAQALEDYLAHLGSYLSDGLHGLVGLTLEEPDGAEGVLSTELAAWLRPGRHVQVVGSSGTGKSHALAHAAAGLAQDGWLPILLRAGVYEGRVEDSLDESVAPFTSQSADCLVRAARLERLPVILLVDAINECPSRFRDRLMLQLSSWCRRAEATLVSTSHEFVNVPAVIGGAQLRTVDPTSQQRAALLRCYGVGPQQEEVVEEECKAFGTAFELSMAAQLTQRLPTGAGRAALLDAYLGEQLQRASQPTALRQVLHRWAMLMDERLTGWLPLAEAQRSAAQVLVALGGAVGVVDEALRSPVVQVRHRRVEFRHEWYAQLLAAEALMWSRESAMELAGELRRPHRRELAVWAVALLSDPDEVRRLLQGLPDTEVLIEALCGRLGPVADGVALAEAQRCLEEAVEAMAVSSIECSAEFEYTIEPRRCWSEYEQAMFTAVGTTAHDGRLLEPLAPLMRENDRAFRRGGWSPTVSRVAGLIAEALNGPIASTGGTQLPAAVITHALRLAWPRRGHNRHQPAGAADLQRWAASLEANDIGLAMLLCLLVRWTDDSEVAALAPALISHAWATKANHLRFASLDLLTSIRTTVDRVTETRVIELLNDVHTDNIWVSTMLVDALHAYGQLTSPYSVDDITEEISSLLASPKQHDAHSRAQRIVESQFEEVISAPFIEAIDALEPAARRALLILAVREGDASLFTDVVLKELIRAKDPAALPAFRYWASHMNVPDPFRQNAISSHLLGIEGCAAHLEIPPPMLGSHEGADTEAWRCYGQILFWLHRPNLSPDDRYARCKPLWGQLTTSLLDAAVDPLQQFQSVAMFAQDIRTSALGLIVDSFPGHIRTVLHHGLRAPDHLTSLFPHPQPDDRTATVLRLLARAGDHSSLQLLARYRDHPGLGGTAADTIRRLNNRPTDS